MYYIEELEVLFYGRNRIYKVKKGDMLESVFFEFGIVVSELRWYYNMYCDIFDLIEVDFKRYLEFVILLFENNVFEIREVEIEK